MRFSSSALWVALAWVLGGCATPMRISLTPEQRAGIHEISARVIVVQDEVIAAVEPSNVSQYTGGGLIGAMVDSSITNTRVKASQELMGPFYAEIENVDYRQEFNETIQRELAHYPIQVTRFTTTPRTASTAELAKMRAELHPGEALLMIYPRYYLTMDFRNLDTQTVVNMWTRDSVGNNPVDRGVLYYQSQPVGPGGKASIALWGAKNAAAFRATLRDSIVETMKLVLMDLDVGTPASPAQAASFAFNTGQSQGSIKGRVVAETGTRFTVLGDDKKLYSLPKPTPMSESAGQ